MSLNIYSISSDLHGMGDFNYGEDELSSAKQNHKMNFATANNIEAFLIQHYVKKNNVNPKRDGCSVIIW